MVRERKMGGGTCYECAFCFSSASYLTSELLSSSEHIMLESLMLSSSGVHRRYVGNDGGEWEIECMMKGSS